MAENKELDITAFYSAIKEQKGIQSIWEKILKMLKDLEPKISDECLKFFCIYFSLIDDGNTCVSLNIKTVFEKWMKKWEGLLLVSDEESFLSEEIFKTVIENGTKEILSGKIPSLVEILDDSKKYTSCDVDNFEKPFVVKTIDDEKWLFAEKYFAAKLSIEDKIARLFPAVEKPSNLNFNNTKKYFKENTVQAIDIDDRQAEAIILGKERNLIINGGPGTGKTTVICYLLWELMKEKDKNQISYCNYNLYLAAPSGKAAERMKESISKSLKDFKESLISEHEEIINKLTVTDSSTIHRLLGVNPGKNSFSFNKENQFDRNSIFIIDEASMIDIQLFKNLLEAIPDEARIFILGDSNQLPSVQEGAVLGELLSKVDSCCVSLTRSFRFNEETEVGRLKNELLKENPLPEDVSKFGTVCETEKDLIFESSKPNNKKTEAEKNEEKSKKLNPVYFYSLRTAEKGSSSDSKKDQIKTIVSNWSKAFCEQLIKMAQFNSKAKLTHDELDDLWFYANQAKILCAEQKSIRGVSEINECIETLLCNGKKVKKDKSGFFTGQLLILTKNQKMFRLYNGDSGIVVSFDDDDFKYLMVMKKASKDDIDTNDSGENDSAGIFRCGDYLFYPLYLLPGDSIETAYAITIHKSQGSGYKNILIFLPEQEGHPLLNRQIAYTAVTRTEGKTYIIATRNALNHAKKTLIERDTKIEL